VANKNNEHIPSEQERKQVEAMASYGVPQGEISTVLGITPKTLRKHYRKELDTAATKANAMVAGKLYKNCMDGKEASIFFWLKTKAKWRETNHLDLTSGNEPINKIELVAQDGKSTD